MSVPAILRLVTGLAVFGLAEARAWLARTRQIPADLSLRDIPPDPPAGMLDGLGSRTFDAPLGKSLFSERLRLDGLVSVWHPER